MGFFITIFCLLAFGPRACVWAAIASAIGACIYPHRLPWTQFLFNVASLTVTAWITAVTYMFLKTAAPAWAPFAQTMGAACAYFLMNSGLLAAIIALSSSKRIRDVWASLLWTGPSYLAGAALAMLVQMWAGANTTFLLTLPILAFVQQSYKTYVDKLEEGKRHLEQRERYIEELQESRQTLLDLYDSMVSSLASAVDAKDQGTHAHIQRVQKFAVGIAQTMHVEGAELEAVRTGALLHDIGKLAIPDHILLKQGPLTEDEYRLMKQHAVIGAEILAPVRFPWPVISVVRHHHERWDGRGYPDELAGTDIPLSARIMTVADVYDALTSDRPYRAAWSSERAYAYLQEQSGIQFDPEVVAALLRFEAREDATAETGASPASSVGQNLVGVCEPPRATYKAGTLYDVAQLLNTNLPLEERCERVCERTVAAIPGTDCAIVVSTLALDHCSEFVPPSNGQATALDEDSFRILAGAGPHAPDFWRGVFLGAHGVLAESASLLSSGTRSEDKDKDKDENKERKTFSNSSFLAAPLVYGDETLGALCWFHPEPGVLGEGEQHLLLAIAEHLKRDLYHHIQFQRTRDTALKDPLTGLHNIRYLAAPRNGRMSHNLAASLQAPYSVLYLDLDGFKPLNDTYGRANGDSVLTDLAYLFQQALCPEDQIVRFGGDEFVVVLPGTERAGAEQTARRLRKVVQDYRPEFVSTNSEAPQLDVSIGVAVSPADGYELHVLISAADARMNEERTAREQSLDSGYAVVKTAEVRHSFPVLH